MPSETSPEPPRIGLVGLGSIGHHHTEQIFNLDATLVGGVDVDADARESYADAHDVSTFEEVDALLNHDLDGLIVTTPNKYHEPSVRAGLDAGVNVLCEKPLAHSLESAERIADAARASDAFCMTGFNNRFNGTVERVIDARESGRFGDVRRIDAAYVRRRGVPGRGSWFTRKAVAGGGALIDIGVHTIDLALYLLDHPEVVEVMGVTRSQFGGREDYTYEGMYGDDHGPGSFDVDDSVTALIRCANGQTISVDVAWATNRDPSTDFVVRGTDSGARFEMEGGDEVTFYDVNRDDDADTPLPTVTESVTEVATHQAEQEMFLDAIRRGTPPERNTIDEALAVQRVLDAIYESSASGRAVQLGDTAPTPTAN